MNEQMNIKIFTSYHKECELLKTNIIYPIQVGANLNGTIYPENLHDNVGENISNKNGQYCELTAQYWAWKNVEADYYGFMHYRRYFSFNPSILEEDIFGNVNMSEISDENVKRLWLNDEYITKMVSQYDIICTEPQNVQDLKQGNNVYEHYKNSPHHRIEDLDTVIEIIAEKYPDYLRSAQKYLKSKQAYFCNMYILKRNIFKEYSSWLFDILQEHEKRSDFSDYDVNEFRVSGFLAERLWGMYFTWLKDTQKIKYKEIQRSFFKNADKMKEIVPAFFNNNIPIVTAIDDKYVPYAMAMIKSLIDNANVKYNYDIVVFNSNIAIKNKNLIKKELCKENVSIRFFDVSKMFANKNLFIHRHFTIEIYYRLMMQDIMKNYDKVIYLDSDMIVNSDISKLFNIDIGSNYVAAVVDADYAGCYKGADLERKNYFEKNMHMESPYTYFNSGVLVMNLEELRKNFTTKDIMDMAESKEWLFPDQDVLNNLCEKKVYFLDMEWNVMIDWQTDASSRNETLKKAPVKMYVDYLKSRKNPKIIHYAGFQKPWNEPTCDMAEYFWYYARKTSIYERLLLGENTENSRKELETMEKEDFKQIAIDGVKETIYIDGEYVKLINMLNKIAPLNSRRRNLMKRISKIVLR